VRTSLRPSRLGGIGVLLLLTAGCAGASEGGGPAAAGSPTEGAAGTSGADNDVVVRVDEGDGSEPVTWTLTCGGTPEGTHPSAEEACAHLATLDEPFAPLPDDQLCTQQYGGPQSAHVAGTWGGRRVDLELTRVDGCRISQWDSLVPLLPAV
jgi:hypothetical protein